MQFRFIWPACFIFLYINVQAQQDSDSLFSGFQTTFYSLPKLKVDAGQELPVSGIKIHDARPDTSYIGVMRKNPGGDQFIRLKGGWAQIQDHYSSLITASGKDGMLHCFIRKLILTDYIELSVADTKNSRASRRTRPWKSGVILIAEFYAEIQDTYYPLYRIDTTISSDDRLQQKGPEYLAGGLKASLAKAGGLNWQQVHQQRTRLSLHQIDSFNTARNSFPALSEAPVKGIYFTFSEFRENKPQVTEYTIQKEKKGEFIYYKNSKGEEVPVLDAWGYCDGSNKYYYKHEEFFRIHRTGNSYTWHGTKNVREKFIPVPVILPLPGVIIGGAVQDIHYTKKIKELCHLDLDSGKIY